jgi:catechol 2,3-dioxygenase-like lactoylglutathione lyase family enzyme
MRLLRDRNAAWPALVVDDVAAAATFYRDVLGFEQVALIGGVPPRWAIFRRNGATILLQEGTSPVRDRRDWVGPPWDAVITVRDLGALHRDLAARAVPGLSDLSLAMGWPFFQFQDSFGNVICVGQSADRFLARLSTPRSYPFARIRARRQNARAAQEEREHLDEFQAFYRGLDNKEDIFYMFFTSGLLHWVMHAESFVPPEVNLVLIGSSLTPDELSWISEHLRRPFHHVRIAVDDITIWDFLLATNEHNFGWLDIDCFVLNSGLFAEMSNIDPKHSMNCIWSMDPGYGFRVATTHLLFLNVEAVRAVAALGVQPTACTFDWSAGSRLFAKRECFSRILSKTEQKLLLRLLPPDAKGRPRFLYGSFYETNNVYQMLARVAGYPINQVRQLVRRCRMPFDTLTETSTDPDFWPEELSDELFHLSAISHYQNYDYGSYVSALYLAAELTMLQETAERLPAYYTAHRDKLVAQFVAAGRPAEGASHLFRQHLTRARGMSEEAADRVLRLAPAAVS